MTRPLRLRAFTAHAVLGWLCADAWPKPKPLTREQAEAWAKSMPDIPPCGFCGRVMMAGVCCRARLNEARAAAEREGSR